MPGYSAVRPAVLAPADAASWPIRGPILHVRAQIERRIAEREAGEVWEAVE